MRKSSDRRGSPRYNIRMAVRFAVQRPHGGYFGGAGITLNISSSGMVIRPDTILFAGDLLTLAADWPLSRIDEQPAYLVVSGSVVWTHALRTAISISRYQLMAQGELRSLAEPLEKGEVRTGRRRDPLLPRVVLVDDDTRTRSIVSAVLRPRGFLIEPINAADAQRLVRNGFPPISLLVTSSTGLWSDTLPYVPTILTLEPDEDTPVSAYTCSPILRKPFDEAAVYDALESLATGRILRHANSA
jgi:hypothetical protein